MPQTKQRKRFVAALKRHGELAAYRHRLRELIHPEAGAMAPAAAQAKADGEFAAVLAAREAEAPPKPARAEPERKPVVVAPDRARWEKATDIAVDIEYAYRCWALEGAELSAAKAAAPSGGALSMLKRVQENAKFSQNFFNQMVPKYLASREQLDGASRRRVESRPVYELIERVLAQADRDAGFLQADTEGLADEPALASEPAAAG